MGNMAIDEAAGVGKETLTTSRVARGAASLAASTVVNMLSQIVIVPLAIKYWGAGIYGEWVTLSAVAGALALTDFGIQSFAVNKIGGYFARGDLGGLHRALHSAIRAQVLIGGVGLLLLSAVLVVTPMSEWLKVSHTAPRAVTTVLILLASEVLIATSLGTVTGLYRATGHLSRAAVFDAARRALMLAITVAALMTGGGLVAVAAVRLSMALATGAFWVRDLRNLLPWLSFWPNRGLLHEGATFALHGLPFLALPLADYLSSQGLLVLLQRTGAGLAVAELATHRTFINAVTTVAGFIGTAAWPEVTRLSARGESTKIRVLFGAISVTNITLVGVGSLIVFPVAASLYPWWTRRELLFDPLLVTLLSARALVWAVYSSSITLLGATNQTRWILISYGASLIAVTGVGALAIPHWGTRGAAFALLLGEAGTLGWLLPLAACRQLGAPYGSFVKAALVQSLAAVILPGGTGLLLWIALPAGPWVRATATVTVLLLALAGGWAAAGSGTRHLVRRALMGTGRIGRP
jgi:O-antigen/teichoic acid export membrane protein